MTNFNKVWQFMHSFGQETLSSPTLPDVDLAELRLDLIQEEVDELATAFINQDIVEIADALTDILYVTYGAGHAFGIDLDISRLENQASQAFSQFRATGIPTGHNAMALLS